MKPLPLLRLAATLLAGPALAQKEAASPLGGFGGRGKEPIKIDADRLDVFDRENKAIFAGNVVAVQGDSTIRCSTMTVHYKRGKEKGAEKPAEGEAHLERFLASRDDFRLEPPRLGELPVPTAGEGWVRTVPGTLEPDGGCDGFFVARLRRAG